MNGAKAESLSVESVNDFRSVTGGGIFGRVGGKGVLVGKANFLRAEGVTSLEALEATANPLQ